MRITPVRAAACLLIAVVCDVASGQISAQEGKWVVAHGADIASKCADYIKTEYGDSNGESTDDSKGESAGDSKGRSAFENAELVRIVTSAPSSWEFYSRDRRPTAPGFVIVEQGVVGIGSRHLAGSQFAFEIEHLPEPGLQPAP